MRDTNLVNALRCVSTAGGPMGDCKKCPFYKTEPIPEDLAGKVNLKERSSCDVDAVVHGRWIHSRYDDCSEQFEIVKCSQCNHEAYAMALYVHGGNYCPNCGAKMDGERKDGGDG